MPLNYQDVELLNHSMENVGNAFAERRREEDARQREIANELLRQKMLQVEQARAESQEAHQQRLEAAASGGKVDTYLQTPDGGVIHFEGPQSGLDTIVQKAQAAGKVLKMLPEKPSASPKYGSLKTSTPLGDLEFFMSTPEEVDKVFEQAKKLGATRPDAAPKPFSVETGGGKTISGVYDPKSGTMHVPTQPTDTVTEKYEAQPGTPEVPARSASSGFLGLGAHPASPAVPAQPATPERTVTRKVPASAPLTAPRKPTRAQAAEYVNKYGRAQAIEELKRAGYDPSGYAD